jgi:hypothetical protein
MGERAFDHDSREASLVLETLASGAERFIALSRVLQSRTGVASVTCESPFRYFRNGPVLALYVDAELDSGSGICWWLELHWPGHWQVQYRITTNDDQGWDVLREYPVAVAGSISEVVRALEDAVSTLICNAESIDFTIGLRQQFDFQSR